VSFHSNPGKRRLADNSGKSGAADQFNKIIAVRPIAPGTL